MNRYLQPDDPRTFTRLRVFNFVMGILHTVQAVLMLILSNDYKLPFTTLFVTGGPTGDGFRQELEKVGELPFGPAVALFLFISAVAHFTLSTVASDWYVRNIKRGMNPARWYEYSLSASVMIVLIAMLTGMYDLPSLLLIFFLNASMIWFGLVMEVHNQTTAGTDWTSFIYGCIAGVVPWIVVFTYLLGAGGDVPDFVYGIFVSIFIFFNVFAVNMWLQYREIGPWKNYLFGEAMYVVLSLTAKSALAWQVFAGALQGG